MLGWGWGTIIGIERRIDGTWQEIDKICRVDINLGWFGGASSNKTKHDFSWPHLGGFIFGLLLAGCDSSGYWHPSGFMKARQLYAPINDTKLKILYAVSAFMKKLNWIFCLL